jgi:phosphoribosyl-dephospho-CoA transferase
MTSLFSPSDGALRRHDLVFVSAAAWRDALKAHSDLAAEPLVAAWADRGWPLIVRRSTPGEPAGLPLGLPLPPARGKRRLAFVMPPGAVVATAPPPLLRDAAGVAPPQWQPTLARLIELALAYGEEARVFGSLAWRLLTGLDYLTPKSDLDVLLPLPTASDVARFTAELAAIETAAPMNLDGELVRGDGAGVNWREIHASLHADECDVLVKTTRDAALVRASHFLGGEVRA